MCSARSQAYGLGSVLNLEVLGGLHRNHRPAARREVVPVVLDHPASSRAPHTRLGLQSETRQTIAPVTLFKGTPFQFTIEVLGEWALRAVADGAAGGSSIHYGPLATRRAPKPRSCGSSTRKGEVLGQLTTQMLLGHDGLEHRDPRRRRDRRRRGPPGDHSDRRRRLRAHP